jgi:glycosyl transferase family 29 (putative sialyltransferase)
MNVARRAWRGDVDPAYAQLVSGRTVAVVGPARTILGKSRGAQIDAHDLVVRFNDTFDLPSRPELAADIGTRTDILYCNQVILQRALDRGLAMPGVKHVVCTNNSLSFSAEKDPRVAQPGRTPPVRIVHAASATLATWLRGNWARTGMVAILDLLSFDVARLFITGMTFYHGGGHLLSPEATEMHPRKNRDGTWAQSPSGEGHDSYLELEVMKELAREYESVVEMDATLTALISPRSP